MPRIVVAAADPAAAVDLAVAALAAGDVVVLPTDTVYGLAANAGDARATRRLFELKGRAANTPIAVLCASAEQALGLAQPGAVDDRVRRAAARGWPGPLTLVLPRRPGLGYELGEPAATVGVRCPDDPLVRAIAAQVGPLATTSANPHGVPTPHDAPGVVALLPASGVGLVVDGGERRGVASTVVDAAGGAWHVLRQGPLTLEDLTE